MITLILIGVVVAALSFLLGLIVGSAYHQPARSNEPSDWHFLPDEFERCSFCGQDQPELGEIGIKDDRPNFGDGTLRTYRYCSRPACQDRLRELMEDDDE